MKGDTDRSASGNASKTRQVADRLRRRGRYDEAFSLYAYLLRTESRQSEDISGLCETASLAERDAEPVLMTVHDKAPHDREVTAALAVLYEQAERHGDLLALVRDAPEVDRDTAMRAAHAAARLGEDRTAVEIYDRMLADHPDDASVRLARAQLKLRERHFDEALDALADPLGRTLPANLSRINVRVGAQRRLGRTDQAAAAASDGVGALVAEDNPLDAARLLSRLGFATAAAHLRSQAIARAEDHSSKAHRRIARRLATHLFLEGRAGEAARLLQRVEGPNASKRRLSPRHQDQVTRIAGALSPVAADPLLALANSDTQLPDAVFQRILARCADRPVVRSRQRSVLMVSGTLGAGGAERQFVLTATGLAAMAGRVDSVDIAVTQPLDRRGNDHQLQTLLGVGIPVHRMTEMPAFKAVRVPSEISDMQLMVNLLPDAVAAQLSAVSSLIVHVRPAVVHGWQDVTGAVAALAGLMLGVPRIVIGTRSLAPDRKEGRNRPYLKTLMSALVQHPRVKLINNSRAGIVDYRRWLDTTFTDIGYLPNGFDFARLTASGINGCHARDRIMVGGVMRLTEEKRPDLWLEVLILLIRRGLPVDGLLIGEGPIMAQLRARLDAAGLGDRVELAGRRSDMADMYRRMDLLLLTSRTEGMPNVLVEAQAFGRPVVATDAGGAAETFVDGHTGTLCTTDDAESIADAVSHLIADPARLSTYGLAASAFVRDTFALPAMLARTLAVYGWVEGQSDG